MHYPRYEFPCPCRFEKTLYEYHKMAPKPYEEILQGPRRNCILHNTIAKNNTKMHYFAAATAVLRF